MIMIVKEGVGENGRRIEEKRKSKVVGKWKHGRDSLGKALGF